MHIKRRARKCGSFSRLLEVGGSFRAMATAKDDQQLPSETKPCTFLRTSWQRFNEIGRMVGGAAHFQRVCETKGCVPPRHVIAASNEPGVRPSSYPERWPLTADQIPWDVEVKGYAPCLFVAGTVAARPDWADPPDTSRMVFNGAYGEDDVDRISYELFPEKYAIDKKTGWPLNPIGRTGIAERGLLGRFGPNKAVDTAVTRWRRDASGNYLLTEDGKRELELFVIMRGDTRTFAIPGGMITAGDGVAKTVLKEFTEEALNAKDLDDEARVALEKRVRSTLLVGGKIVFAGYVDDPRNTDNAWMETVSVYGTEKKRKLML